MQDGTAIPTKARVTYPYHGASYGAARNAMHHTEAGRNVQSSEVDWRHASRTQGVQHPDAYTTTGVRVKRFHTGAYVPDSQAVTSTMDRRNAGPFGRETVGLNSERLRT